MTGNEVGINVADPTRPRLYEGIIAIPEWTAAAACTTAPDLFFPGPGRPDLERAAKAICATCPVATQCLEYALAYEAGRGGINTSYAAQGVWGGLNPGERNRLRQQRATDGGDAA